MSNVVKEKDEKEKLNDFMIPFLEALFFSV